MPTSWPMPYMHAPAFQNGWPGQVPAVKDVEAALRAAGQIPGVQAIPTVAGGCSGVQPEVPPQLPPPAPAMRAGDKAGATQAPGQDMSRAFTEWFGRGVHASAPPPSVAPVQQAAAAQHAQQQQQQWNAMLQYYAYYTFFLSSAGCQQQAVPPAGPPPIAAAPPPPAPPANAAAFAGAAFADANIAQIRAWHEQQNHAAARQQQVSGGVVAVEATRAVSGRDMGQHGEPPAPAVPQPVIAGAGNPQRRISSDDEDRPAFGFARTSFDKRDRDGSESDDNSSGSGGKARKKRNSMELKVCVNCGVSRTPFWRKERSGVGSLCNACGLYLAKNDAPRPKMLWKRSGGEDQQQQAK